MRMSMSLRQTLICDVCGQEYDEGSGMSKPVSLAGEDTTLGHALSQVVADSLQYCPCCQQEVPTPRNRHYRARASRYSHKRAMRRHHGRPG